MYRKNAWLKYDQKQVKEVIKTAEGYNAYLSYSKTELLAVRYASKSLDAK